HPANREVQVRFKIIGGPSVKSLGVGDVWKITETNFSKGGGDLNKSKEPQPTCHGGHNSQPHAMHVRFYFTPVTAVCKRRTRPIPRANPPLPMEWFSIMLRVRWQSRLS